MLRMWKIEGSIDVQSIEVMAHAYTSKQGESCTSFQYTNKDMHVDTNIALGSSRHEKTKS